MKYGRAGAWAHIVAALGAHRRLVEIGVQAVDFGPIAAAAPEGEGGLGRWESVKLQDPLHQSFSGGVRIAAVALVDKSSVLSRGEETLRGLMLTEGSQSGTFSFPLPELKRSPEPSGTSAPLSRSERVPGPTVSYHFFPVGPFSNLTPISIHVFAA